MEQIFKKSDHDRYPQKIFANQLITVDDLLQFKRQLIDELLEAFRAKAPSNPVFYPQGKRRAATDFFFSTANELSFC